MADARVACAAGLRYEDLLAENPTVNEALRRLPEHELVARDQRMKRAFVLSQKKIYLPEELQSDPLANEYYLDELIDEVVKEEDERAAYRAGDPTVSPIAKVLARARTSS